jgi:uncharacterized protein YjiS (DUF1127 family)
MMSITGTQWDVANTPLARIEWVRAAIDAAADWALRGRRRMQTIAALEALDRRALSDIGLNRADIYCFADRPAR